MDWDKVARRLASEAARLRRDAPAAFPNDHQTQQEMLTRASIFETFAVALWDGLGHQHS
jgi:hypothetical protein